MFSRVIFGDLIQEGMITRTCIKSRKPFLFRFRRWEILKRNRSGLHRVTLPCLRRTPSLSVVPLLLGDSDSLSVSYGMEPEQEALSIVSFKD